MSLITRMELVAIECILVNKIPPEIVPIGDSKSS